MIKRFEKKVNRIPQKMNFSIKDLFSKCDQIGWKLQIWSHLLKKSLMENFMFYAMQLLRMDYFKNKSIIDL